MDLETIRKVIYPEHSITGITRHDGTVQFYTYVNSLLDANSVVADFGAGRGAIHSENTAPVVKHLANLRGRVRRVVGIDIDPAVKLNPSLDEAIAYDGTTIPLPDSAVDLIIADYVFEHISNPRKVASELMRVLRPNGWICARTPNKYGYVAYASRLLRGRLRSNLLTSAQQNRIDEDKFETFYLLNTKGDVKRAFGSLAERVTAVNYDAEPSYHFDSGLMFAAEHIVHRLSPRGLRSNFMFFIQKAGELADNRVA